MVSNDVMESSTSKYFSNLPVYQKAMEIFSLSRRISDYISEGKSTFKLADDNQVCYAGDIITYSSKLAPSIKAAESHTNRISRYKHVLLLKKFTHRLTRQCERLERQTVDGKDYVGMLHTELKKFKRLQLSWEASLK